jgi:energy-coupling factor transporter ATP-binding protein EcfA2
MKRITGLIGRDELVADVVREIRKGKHVLLTGPVGVGKSAVLKAAIWQIERREDERRQLEPLSEGSPAARTAVATERRKQRLLAVVYLHEHQAKGQFVTLARRLLQTGIVKPSALGLAKGLDSEPLEEIAWASVKRTVNRSSVRDLTGALIPALHEYKDRGGQCIVAVDDMTNLTPTQQAFWLAVFDCTQVVACASTKKQSLSKLWWKMKEIEVKPLTPEASEEIVKIYIVKKGVLIESPDLYVSHVVKQSGGNPQAIRDMLDESDKERVVNKQQIREMRHQAEVRYLDFTPVMLVSGACIIGARYIGMGMGDKALYIMSGMAAALFMSLRFFLFKGAGKAN